nr:hypothetical protein [Tanacetum cinerariifolium]
MSTRSSARNIFPPLDNPKLTIRIRSHADPTLLNDFEMATERNGDLPVPDFRTMEGLCQPSLNGRGGPISLIAIQATNFGLKNDMIQQVKNSYKFHGLSGDDANKHLEKFLHVTQSIKVNGVTNDTLPQRSESSSSITSSFDMEIEALKAEMEKINKNQRSESSSSITSSFDTKIAALKAEMTEINKNLMRVLQVNQQVKAVILSCETCAGPHSFNDCPTTVSQTQNLFSPLDNPELTIRRRSRTDPTLLKDFEMAVEGNGDPPVPDLRTMEELCQPSLNGRGGPIALIVIQATNFGLMNDMIQQVHNSCQLHGLPGDDANEHLDKFLHVTQIIKVNGVTDDALRGTFMKRRPEESYELIENMTAHHNDWDTSAQRSESSSSITSSFDLEIAVLKAEMTKINKNLMRVLQSPLAKPITYMLREPIK